MTGPYPHASYRLRADRDLNDEVEVYGPKERGTWHTSRTCLGAARMSSRLVTYVQRARYVGAEMLSWYRKYPCARCARPVALDLALRAAFLQPTRARRLVLACPKGRLGQGANHARCPVCAELVALAGRHELTFARTSTGYTLVFAAVHEDLSWVAANAYVTHPYPDHLPDPDADTLAIAWSLRSGAAKDPSVELPALQRPQDRTWAALSTPGFEQAHLVTAPPR